MPESSGNSWFGWKFSHKLCEMGGEERVTRYKSGGVPGGRFSGGWKGVVGRVDVPRVPVMKVSLEGVRVSWMSEGGAGVCGRERS